jgi:hypothetical protein
VTRRKKANAVLHFKRINVGGRQPDRYLHGYGHTVVGEHEALQGFVPQAVVADGRQNKRGGTGREVLFLDNNEVIAIYKIAELRRSGALAKEVVWTNFGNTLKKVGKRCEAIVPLVIAQVGQFGTVIGEAVNLAMIEFRRTDHLSRCEPSGGFPAEATESGQFVMFGHPARKRGW